MQKFRVTLAVEAKDAEQAGAFVGTLGAPKYLQWDEPLACETLEVEDLDPIGEVDMIPVCPECLSEEVEELDASEADRWRCGNCGASFDVPVEASN